MNYYRINLRPREHPEYCFIKKPPKGTDKFTYRMAKGLETADRYPEDTHVQMDPKTKGFQLPSLIGNTKSFLIVAEPVKEVIENINTGQTECLPLTIIDHKGNEASKDYFIINPIGTVDCLNLEASEIKYHNGDIVAVKRFVLDPEKLAEAPDLFRPREDPYVYIISQRLVLALKEIGATNIYVYDLEQQASSEN